MNTVFSIFSEKNDAFGTLSRLRYYPGEAIIQFTHFSADPVVRENN
jgi:hypothetical protein